MVLQKEKGDDRTGLELVDAMATFCPKSWIETKLRECHLPDGSISTEIRVLLRAPMSTIFAELAAKVWHGEIECWARRNDPTSSREMIPPRALIRFRPPSDFHDLIDGVLRPSDGATLYDVRFKVSGGLLSPKQRLLDEHAARVANGTASKNQSEEARQLLDWLDVQPERWRYQTTTVGSLRKLLSEQRDAALY